VAFQHCPPPRNFKAAENLVWVRSSPVAPGFISKRRRTGKRAQGIRYEKKVHAYLGDLYGEHYFPSEWFYFLSEDEPRPRWCQPDGLLILPKEGRIVIVEVKYQHTADAWWQLKHLYFPVIRKCFGNDWKISLCEVVKWYDPATVFPEPVRMAREITVPGPSDFGVHIWRP
jgi:hypothetical protein